MANAWFVWTSDARLEAQLAAIRAAGEPLSLAELAREPIPPEQNAATFLRRAKADAEAMLNELWKVYEARQIPGPPLSPEEQKTFRAAFDAYPKVIPLLERAAACPDYDAQLDYTLPPREFLERSLDHVGHVRAFCRVLYCRALLLAAEGNRDEAVQTALTIFRLARHFDRYPMIVGYLVAIAVRRYAIDAANEALQSGPVSKEVRDALDAELARQERMEGYAWMIKSERTYGLDSFRTLPGRNFWLVLRGFWNWTESQYLDVMQGFLALAHDASPYRQAFQRIQEIRGKISTSRLGAFVQLIFPAMQAPPEAVTRTRALVRSLRALNALQVRASAGSDEVPKLSELGLSAETTTDPYTGEPLHVKKTPQGWLVYSVGKNFEDDGGKLDDTYTDVGVGPLPAAAKPEGKQETDR
jgi:hypothetical protein